MRCAVLDLGSTSFQLLVTDVDDDGSLTHVLRDRVILNLGAEVAASGRVSDELLDRALHVVARFRDVAERSGAERLWPVATAAFREAANQPWLSKALRGTLGVPVRILDGDEEVRCTITGIRASVALPQEPWLAFDLGGGSLEIALVQDGELTWTDTFPLGAARIQRTEVGHDPMTRTERKDLKRLVADLLGPAVEACSPPDRPPAVLAGGTAGALARLIAARGWPEPPTSLNQYEVETTTLVELTRALCTAPLEERLKMPGIDERRADILPAGALVLSTALELFGVERAMHSEWGLREGVVLREVGARLPGTPAELRQSAIDRLARDWQEDDGHAAAVRALAEQLFDGTQPIHDLGPDERELLGAAARVHDIGTRISPDKHHKHGAYLVEHIGLRGFAPREIAIMACLVRFQRGSLPKPTYPPYAALAAADRESCRVLVGILRVAHALVRGPADDIAELTVARSGDVVRIEVTGRKPERGVAEALDQAPVLGRALGVSIDIVVPESIRPPKR